MKMAVQEKENQTDVERDEQPAAKNGEALNEASPNELRLPIWSVISFEKPETGGLTYAQAEEKMRELEKQDVSGLCIVTDDVAARIAGKD